MDPNRLSPALVVSGAAIALLFAAGCASQLTDSGPVALSSPASSIGSTVPAYESDRAVFDERRTNVDTVADRSDPVSVARAFVTLLTNRREGESSSEWRERLRRWATQSAVDSMGARDGIPVFDTEADRRGARAVGVVVGEATIARNDSTAVVALVVDEALVFDGQPLDVEYFVTWSVTLERQVDGWWVAGVGFGSGS